MQVRLSTHPTRHRDGCCINDLLVIFHLTPLPLRHISKLQHIIIVGNFQVPNIYRVRNKDGLYWDGCTYAPKFTKKGKIYKQLMLLMVAFAEHDDALRFKLIVQDAANVKMFFNVKFIDVPA